MEQLKVSSQNELMFSNISSRRITSSRRSRKCGAMVPAALGTFGVARHNLALDVGNRFFTEKHFKST
jgi:hypothetical protein